MAEKRKKTNPEWVEVWLELLWEERAARFARADALEAERRARLRRWTFGLFGREPTQPTA